MKEPSGEARFCSPWRHTLTHISYVLKDAKIRFASCPKESNDSGASVRNHAIYDTRHEDET